MCEITSLSATSLFGLEEKGERLVPEYQVALDVIQRILSDPIWRERAKKVSCKEDLRRLLLQFCSENGEIIKVSDKTILLYADY